MDHNSPVPPKEFEIGSIGGLLRRQLRVIVITTIVLFGLAGGFLVATTEKYTATALILVDPDSKNILEVRQSYSSTAGRENARVDSEVEILRSNAVALAVIASEVLTQDPEFGARVPLRKKLTRAIGIANAATISQAQLVSRTLESFQSAVSIRRRGLTYLISVSATSRSPQKAMTLANRITSAYVEQQIQAKVSASLAAKDVLEEQIISSRHALTRYETALDRFIESNIDLIGATGDQGALAGINQKLREQERALTDKKTALNQAQQLLQQEDWISLATVLGVADLADMGKRRQSYFSHGETPAPESSAIDFQQQLAELDFQLSNMSEFGLRSMTGEILRLEQNVAGLRNQLRRSVFASDLSPVMLAEIYAVQQETKIARDQYQSLLSRMRDLETQARIQIADSRVISPAIEPVYASYPNRNLVFLVALAAAMGIGVSLAFLNEYVIGGVTSSTQLGELLQVPVAAVIPLNIEQNTNRLSIADTIIDAPLSVYAESVRKLRAAIDQSFRSGADAAQKLTLERARVVLVSSALPEEGKTTTALALARTYAQSGRKTLLIDADLRRPSLHRHLGFEPANGFLDYLQNPADQNLSGAFYARDPASSLALIMGAKRSALPTDQLLSSAGFETLLNQAKEVYDIVIVDSPPLLPVVDARYIAHYADAVVLIVKWAATNQGDLNSAVQPLKEAMKPGAALLPVLAQVRGQTQKSAYGDYGSAYSAAI